MSRDLLGKGNYIFSNKVLAIVLSNPKETCFWKPVLFY
jgi:hypothetical protein